MAHHVCARYNEEDHLLIPPLRTLGFNPKLNANDNLLAQSYVETLDISFPEAMQRIEEEVGALNERLLNDGVYTLNGIGMLSVNGDGNIEFTPIKAGLLTPELYALDSIPVKMLADLPNNKVSKAEEAVVDKEPAVTVKTNVNDDVKPIGDNIKDDAISIKLSVIRNAAAVIIALLGFFLFTSPLAKGNLEMGMVNINTDMLYRIMPKVLVTEGNEIAKPVMAEGETDNSPKIVKEKSKETSNNAEAAEAKKVYCIVMASQVSRNNGEAFIDIVHREGFTSARMIDSKGGRRIVYGEYSSETDAQKELKKLRDNKFFEQAWVYEIKQ